ncbi:MAG: hypothetical protein ACRC8A_18170 [Microcoleaceae cyanobacterium]
MASHHQVQHYLAHWFQLGKRVVLHNGAEFRQPQPVIEGDRYSRAFEECWQELLASSSGDCYLEGTTQTIAELLTLSWDIETCSRCAMPVPMPVHGLPSPCCPCADLPTWPNLEMPQPRLPVNTQTYLQNLCHRLTQSMVSDES